MSEQQQKTPAAGSKYNALKNKLLLAKKAKLVIAALLIVILASVAYFYWHASNNKKATSQKGDSNNGANSSSEQPVSPTSPTDKGTSKIYGQPPPEVHAPTPTAAGATSRAPQ